MADQHLSSSISPCRATCQSAHARCVFLTDLEKSLFCQTRSLQFAISGVLSGTFYWRLHSMQASYIWKKKSFYFMMYQEIAQIVKNLWSIYFDCMSLIRPPPTSFKSISKLGSLYEMMSLWILLIYGRLKRSLWSLFLAEKPSSIILHSTPLATLTVEGDISSLVPLASAQGYVRWYHSFFILLSIQLIEFPMRRLKWRPKTTLFWRKSSFFRRIKTTLPNTICCSTTLALPVTWTRNENTNPKIKSLAW